MGPEERLAWGLNQFDDRRAHHRFGIQSAVLLHMLSTLPGGDAVPVIWVDTGYLPAETYCYVTNSRISSRSVCGESERLSPARMRPCMVASGESAALKTWRPITASGVSLWSRPSMTSGFAAGPAGATWSDRSPPLNDGVGHDSRPLVVRPLLEWTQRDVYYYMQSNNLPQHPLFGQVYSTVGDWHSSGPDGNLVVATPVLAA